MLTVPTNIDKMLHCRFCGMWKQCNELLLFGNDNETQKQVSNIVELLKLDYLDTSNHKLPRTICKSCFNVVNEINNFLRKVKESQIYLNSVYCLKNEMEGETKVEVTAVNNQFKLDYETEIYLDKHEIEEYNVKIKHEYPIMADGNNLSTINKTSIQKSTKMSTCKSTQIIKVSSGTIKDKTTKTLPSNEKLKWKTNDSENSWLSYPWYCIHCKVQLDTIEDVRTHSKEQHGKCYGFKCVDCCNRYNTFKGLINHIREHREILRYCCVYCNEKFDSHTQCLNHTTSHCEGVQKACYMCGEVLPDSEALEHHQNAYTKFTYRIRRRPKLVATNALSNCGAQAASWVDYEWTCQSCSLKVSDADTLRNHAQEAHNRCFSIKCMDCVMIAKNYDQFVRHVYKHRPYLKQFCQYCNKNIPNQKILRSHINKHIYGPQKPCDGCGQILQNNELLQQHMKLYVVSRPKHTVTPEDLTCNICKKSHSSIYRLREHKKTHDDKRERKYTCDTCGSGFLSLGTLKEHIKTHDAKTQVCKVCQQTFCTKGGLKEHVLTHLKEKSFKCDDCGKTFITKLRLKYHLKWHTGYKPHICQHCSKPFRFKNDLKIHLHQHTGLRPYACDFCDKTFTNRGNCNKHMIAIHGVLYCKKRESNVKAIDDTTKEWMDALMQERFKNTV